MSLKVILLRYTPEPEKTIAIAARLCYSSADIESLNVDMNEKKAEALIEKLLEMGHLSPFEHASFTFGIQGVSRALTHQLVRHRIASYSQQSQRYVDSEDFHYITPPSVKAIPELEKKFVSIMEELNSYYKEFSRRVPYEDARYLLPNSAETRIIVTMNARELFHFFGLRCCNRAQWEIRDMAIEMLRILRHRFPIIFRNAGPPCLRGPCREGKLYCGKIEEVRKFFRNL